tara:strand:+ start:143 stop:334 length:192 start_codon:yes stop_codon:yes gene_type:complete
MLVIPVHKNNIDRALKTFRYRFKKTQVLKKIRENRYHIKKSQKKREEIQKAIDIQKWNLENGD